MTINMKKTTVAVLLLTASTGFCGTMGALVSEEHSAKDGFYLGAGVGTSFNNYNFHALNYSTGTTYSGVNNTTKNNNTNIIGNVFFGYGYTAPNSFYLGLEAGTNFPGRSTNISNRPGVSIIGNNIYSDTLTTQDNITLDILPGFRPNQNWLIYGRAGLAIAELEWHHDANPTANVEVFNARASKVGGRFGAGITYTLSHHLSASVDYYYSMYQKFTATVPKYTTSNQSTGTYNFVGASITYTV